jgi:lipopolysaccharide transport system ATP-binding protein
MIKVHQLCKQFRLYNSPLDRLKEILLQRTYHHTHCALDGISFTLQQGEALAVLGQNGAGKSTLLKLLTGVMLPDSGEIIRQGSITGLLELGTGFDHALSGYDNIMVNGLLIGMTRAHILKARDQIIDFSELGQYIHEPVRTYSSGMVMRLAFAIAIHAEPACFVVDEALSVGDGHFQQKCIRKIQAFRQAGGSIIFVSHDLNAVKVLCDRAIVLDQGKISFSGSAADGVNHYNRIMARMDQQDTLRHAHPVHHFGSGEARITKAEITGEDSGSALLAAGENAVIRLCIEAQRPLPRLSAGILIRDRFGQDIFGTNTHHHQLSLSLDKGAKGWLLFRLPMRLAPGKYTLTAALHADDNHLDNCYHWCDNLIQFEIAGFKSHIFTGITCLPARLEWRPHHSRGKQHHA